MQSQTYRPRDPKTPLDIDIDNIAYNETYEEDLEYYGLEEIIEPLEDLSEDDWTNEWPNEDELSEWEDTLDDGLDELPDDFFYDDNVSEFID
jgi:hypothetical protein